MKVELRTKLSVMPSLAVIEKSEWQLDSEAQECFLCHKVFTLIMRRHHCRLCGHAVCNKCSTNRKALIQSNDSGADASSRKESGFMRSLNLVGSYAQSVVPSVWRSRSASSEQSSNTQDIQRKPVSTSESHTGGKNSLEENNMNFTLLKPSVELFDVVTPSRGSSLLCSSARMGSTGSLSPFESKKLLCRVCDCCFEKSQNELQGDKNFTEVTNGLSVNSFPLLQGESFGFTEKSSLEQEAETTRGTSSSLCQVTSPVSVRAAAGESIPASSLFPASDPTALYPNAVKEKVEKSNHVPSMHASSNTSVPLTSEPVTPILSPDLPSSLDFIHLPLDKEMILRHKEREKQVCVVIIDERKKRAAGMNSIKRDKGPLESSSFSRSTHSENSHASKESSVHELPLTHCSSVLERPSIHCYNRGTFSSPLDIDNESCHPVFRFLAATLLSSGKSEEDGTVSIHDSLERYRRGARKRSMGNEGAERSSAKKASFSRVAPKKLVTRIPTCKGCCANISSLPFGVTSANSCGSFPVSLVGCAVPPARFISNGGGSSGFGYSESSCSVMSPEVDPLMRCVQQMNPSREMSFLFVILRSPLSSTAGNGCTPAHQRSSYCPYKSFAAPGHSFNHLAYTNTDKRIRNRSQILFSSPNLCTSSEKRPTDSALLEEPFSSDRLLQWLKNMKRFYGFLPLYAVMDVLDEEEEVRCESSSSDKKSGTIRTRENCSSRSMHCLHKEQKTCVSFSENSMDTSSEIKEAMLELRRLIQADRGSFTTHHRPRRMPEEKTPATSTEKPAQIVPCLSSGDFEEKISKAFMDHIQHLVSRKILRDENIYQSELRR